MPTAREAARLSTIRHKAGLPWRCTGPLYSFQMDLQTATAPSRELPRKLGLLDSTSIVVGTMIGSAIFLLPHTIAQNVHSVPLTLTMWLLGGVVSMFGALAYA